MKNALFENIVIGSGPGGAIATCLLAEAGRETLLLEEGEAIGDNEIEPFSVAEMRRQYRNGGVTMAFGKPRVQYVEGATLGGGSEINSGLYYRLPDKVKSTWQEQFGLNLDGFEKHEEIVEKDISVSFSPHAPPPPSIKLREGAKALGWSCAEVPRWHRYDIDERQTMSRTYIPRAIAAGAKVQTGAKATRVSQNGNGWLVTLKNRQTIGCKRLFLAAGAIQTPLILQKSGLISAAKTLHMHPTIKVIAHFQDEVNSRDMGVPTHQIKQFDNIGIGCSISSPHYLSTSMLNRPDGLNVVRGDWKRLASYYAMIVPEARGVVRKLPLFDDAFVSIALSDNDLAALSIALKKLCEVLFAAGADRLYPSIDAMAPLTKPSDVDLIPDRLPRKQSALMTIHLTSSMIGEIDEWGALSYAKNLVISDASALPSAPGVNPQGVLLSLARRNITKFLEER
ncbi:MAG: GMC family oxidoreductase N-terminal domain-containing protein [Helicobacteraceae bacterium]|jgi:hypothetical protein|nr:GMC family oxidoreductase N-terminal domain-containing protein [Helicobacteraceae bacterium]